MGATKLTASSEKILNTIRANATPGYQDRIPVATRDNIAKVGEAILNYEADRNEFLHALVNRISYVVVSSKMSNNPLKKFKRGTLEFGDTVEEIFVGISKAQTYDPHIAETEVFKRVIPDVSAMFHKQNRQDFYKTTIENETLRTAFLSYNGVEDLISKITDSLYNGDNYDEFILMKQLLVEAINNGFMNVQKVNPVVDEASAKEFVIQVKGISNAMEFDSTNYNYANVLTNTPKSDQVLFMLPNYDARIDVDVLASAFNMNKSEFLGQRVLVNDFNGLEKQGVVAVLVDKDWFMIWDTLFKFTEQYNAQGLYWNYFLHHWQILSYSLYSNAVVFVTDDTSLTGITISGNPTTYSANSVIQLSTKAEGTGVISSSVTWAISGNTDPSTTISQQGMLVIGPNESGSIVVKAASNENETISGTITIQPKA